jgi:hypothetical protein
MVLAKLNNSIQSSQCGIAGIIADINTIVLDKDYEVFYIY